MRVIAIVALTLASALTLELSDKTEASIGFLLFGLICMLVAIFFDPRNWSNTP